MGLKCKHGLSVDAYCSMCFNEKQIPVDAFFQARADAAGEAGIRNPQGETKEPYLSGYRAGWNDAMMSMLEHIKREEK
jgi:hypothetical protein